MKEIEGLAAGTLPPDQASGISSHVEGCDECREVLADCRANLEYFAGVRQVLVQSAGSDGETTRDMTSPVRVDSKTYLPSRPDIPGYTIVRELHRGGQGIVYEAVQESTKRKIAIKLLLEGRYASPAARKRFEREVELVASLKHPNIISIFHSGLTQDGHDYYVMDYVRGASLHRYVQDRRLPFRQALGLFATVCEAVGYAHQKGIIHRDLKPSNILVDSTGEPKVLDFGLAKMIGGPDTTLVSLTGQVVGTLPYISPEQARGNPEEIDVRTDVYALGVILYQLLTGQYPYPVTGQLAEVLHHIEQTPPTPPSKAWQPDSGISSTGDRKPASMHCPIDDEVQTIVLKALAKERERRYQSVGELARDVRSYLAGRPIEAKRDSNVYVFRKLISRYRLQVRVGAILLIFVAGGLTLYTIQRQRIARQQAALNVEEAGRVMAALVQDPAQALTDYAGATSAVQASVGRLGGELSRSDSFAQRLVGAPSALMFNPDEFWKSIDGGPLWQNGEWLQIARVRWPDPRPVIDKLRPMLRAGAPRQQYVAICLAGVLGRPAADLADECAQIVASSTHPGVIVAARWAAARLGKTVPIPTQAGLVPDDISSLTFVRVPESSNVRSGPAREDADRWPDEVPASQPASMNSFYLATTETNLAAYAAFANDAANSDLYPSVESPAPEKGAAAAGLLLAAQQLRGRLKQMSPGELASTPADWISLTAAKRYCDWLTVRARAAGLSRHYRLPTEAEWEYACHGGNDKRFCYGDSADYTTLFAHANGDTNEQRVAQHMPNFHGVFDMHGGLWEWCDTPYPADLVRDPAVTSEQRRQLFVLHGGALYSPAVRCRCSQRNYGDPHSPGRYWGFRVVMDLVSR